MHSELLMIRGRQYEAFYRFARQSNGVHPQMVGRLVELVRVRDDVRVWPRNK
jgi:hypothetical protein